MAVRIVVCAPKGASARAASTLAKNILHLRKQTPTGRRILHQHRLTQLAQQILLRLGQLRRSGHADLYNQIALAMLIQVRYALGPQFAR